MKTSEEAANSVRASLDALVGNIFLADQAYFLLRTPTEFRAVIDANNFGVLFGALRVSLSEKFILSISKIFERDGGRFPAHSIATLLAFLETHKTDLRVLQRYQFLMRLETLGFGHVRLLEKASDSEVTSAVVEFFRETLPDISKRGGCPLSDALNSVRAIRDKRIAHQEKIAASEIPNATWDELNSLLNYAKRFVGVIGWGYAATAYEVDDGRFVLTDDAMAASLALKRLMKMVPRMSTDSPGVQ